MRAVIVVMARSPEQAVDQIKTRLAPAVPHPQDRAALYRAFLADTIATCRRVAGATLRVAYTPEGATAGLSAIGVASDELIAQRGPDLGARERALFEDLFAAGFDRVVLIGSDLPTLPVRVLRTAVARLRVPGRRIVLGPTEDGGYYLLGLGRPRHGEVPDLFTGVRWSTRFALGDTLARAAAAGWPVALLPVWYDVDDEVGLARLRRVLEDPGTAARALATAAVLGSLLARGAVGV